mgnify:CR=1 FL=1
MALELKLEQTQFGVPAPKAYARVTNFFGNKDQMQVQVAIYYDKNAKDSNLSTVKEEAHYINIEDLKGDIIPAIYAVLKTLDQYKNSKDC